MKTLSTMNYDIPGSNVSMFFTYGKFPAGENHVFIKELEVERLPKCEVFFVEDSMDLMIIGMKVDILRRAGFQQISMVIPYLPYARQDRYTVDGESFSLKVFASFINSLKLNKVYTVDPHSDVSGVVDNLVELEITRAIDQVIESFTYNPSILSPDAGAEKKIHRILKDSFYHELQVFSASKKRNLATGEITETVVPDMPNTQVLIIDDISDGGRTFIEIAKKLNPDIKKYLYVTHGVFSKPDVFQYFDKVFTTNTYSGSHDSDNLETIHLTYKKVSR